MSEKTKVTKADMRAMFDVVCVRYCGLASLLTFERPYGYSTRAEGWACDYYVLPLGENQGRHVAISTGYAPIGRKPNEAAVRKYEAKARRFLDKTRWSKSWRYKKTILDRWINELAQAI